jgi:hypothetical protein
MRSTHSQGSSGAGSSGKPIEDEAHVFLCSFQSAFWHSLPQYRTTIHREHFFTPGFTHPG